MFGFLISCPNKPSLSNLFIQSLNPVCINIPLLVAFLTTFALPLTLVLAQNDKLACLCAQDGCIILPELDEVSWSIMMFLCSASLVPVGYNRHNNWFVFLLLSDFLHAAMANYSAQMLHISKRAF